MENILVTGANGQIGSELIPVLQEKYGPEAVIPTDITEEGSDDGRFEVLDVTDADQLESAVKSHDIDAVIHLAAILSAKGEEDPKLAFRINVDGLYNVLELARRYDFERVLVPSSIAVYGPDVPPRPAERTVLSPITMYGITKVVTENLARYYSRTYGLDVRGVRFPGLLSYETKPGGGSTDYAVEAFYAAVLDGQYRYFVDKGTTLPFVYMPDAITAIKQLFAADVASLRFNCEYNVSAMSFSAAELTCEIRKHVPRFRAEYESDTRQKIADSWPEAVDDTAAREDWGWNPSFDFEATVEDMLSNFASD